MIPAKPLSQKPDDIETFRQSHIRQALTEYDQTGDIGAYTLIMLHHSYGDADGKFTYVALGKDEAVVVKIDLRGEMRREFASQHEVFGGFQAGVDQVAEPLWLSESGQAMIVRYYDNITIRADLQTSARKAQRRTMVQLGRWLAQLHTLRDVQQDRFKPGWMMSQLDAQAETVASIIDQTLLATAFERLRHWADIANGTQTRIVFCHNDAHCDNFLLGDGGLIGIDFAAAKQRPYIHDIGKALYWADDAIQSSGVTTEPSPSGVARHLIRGFRQGYGDTIHPNALQFMVTFHAVKEWLERTSRQSAEGKHRMGKASRFEDNLRRILTAQG